LTTYDRIGACYRRNRKEDPRLARLIAGELQDARTVVNVGAGTGAYEPVDRFVVAVEPSGVMLQQRPPGAAPAAQAIAERLPFRDGAFDAAMAVLTVHHWSDQHAGMRELSRVARERIVVLTWDASSEGFWLLTEYFPQSLEADRKRFPPVERLASFLGDPQVITSFASCRDLFPLQRLEEDLATGKWQRRNGKLLDEEELDIGYRLVVGRPTSGWT
jgi:SAM-dependent methyltransferase